MRDNMTMTATTDQWMKFYQQPLMDSHGHDHDHVLTPNTSEGLSHDATTVMMMTSTMPSSESNNNSILSQLSPKGNVSKPIRRRSRASKRTPTTLLNANTTNFRALVQQFTGCPSTTMSTLGVHKGPITLNFQQEKVHHNTNSRVVLPISDRTYNNNSSNNQVNQVPPPFPWQKQENQQHQLSQQNLLQPQQQQQQPQPQSGNYSFDYVKNSGFLPTTTMDVSHDGLILDNDFNLPDLTANGFPDNDTFYKSEL